MRLLATLLVLAVGCGSPGLNPTSLSGTVFAPNGTLALYGATVYIPLGDTGAITPGATCSRCEANLPGGALVNVLSDPAGRFTLENVPVGRNIPLVIQIGKWRRQVSIPEVLECQDNTLPPTLTSLPKSKDEGDMPRIAMVTGGCDALECLIKKLGISPNEFTPSTGTGRIHMYAANGANHLVNNEMFGTATSLWGDLNKLKQYDIVMNSCECSQDAASKTQAMMDNMKAYADVGGRLFLSHYHHVWIAGERGVPTHAPAVWPGIATCQVDSTGGSTAVIDQVNNPRGPAFATWMVNVMGSTTLGTLPVSESKQSCTAVDLTKAERWVYYKQGSTDIPQNFQFLTPNEAPKDDRCGKVVFSDMHVSSSGGSSSPSTPFPMGCQNTPLSPQEKALAFMFFDIASCVGQIF
ncbi:MAG: Tryptophan synthase alpha chain [Deltaproteobacteria bacterium]|nr:Tryptophan synthase alpha chain [Deltaproteobacteria bacterium]